jgi:hypothetical protein
MAGDAWKLKVFQRAYQLSLELHRVSLGWPRVEQYGGIADQLWRSSKHAFGLGPGVDLRSFGGGRGSPARLGCRVPPLSGACPRA